MKLAHAAQAEFIAALCYLDQFASPEQVGAITYATGIPVEDQRLLKAMEDNGGEPELAPRLLGNARVHGSGVPSASAVFSPSLSHCMPGFEPS